MLSRPDPDGVVDRADEDLSVAIFPVRAAATITVRTSGRIWSFTKISSRILGTKSTT
jgi:hypothetical protein